MSKRTLISFTSPYLLYVSSLPLFTLFYQVLFIYPHVLGYYTVVVSTQGLSGSENHVTDGEGFFECDHAMSHNRLGEAAGGEFTAAKDHLVHRVR